MEVRFTKLSDVEHAVRVTRDDGTNLGPDGDPRDSRESSILRSGRLRQIVVTELNAGHRPSVPDKRTRLSVRFCP